MWTCEYPSSLHAHLSSEIFWAKVFPQTLSSFSSNSFSSAWIPSFHKARISLFSLLIFLPHSSHLPVGLTCWQGNILTSQQKTTLPLGSCSPVEWTHHLWNPQYTTWAVFRNVVMSGMYWMQGWAIWPKSYIMIWQSLYHDNNIYHNIVIYFTIELWWS